MRPVETLELGDKRRNLHAGHEDALLTLEQDILGPANEPCEVPLWLQLPTDPEVLRTLLEEGVGDLALGDLLAALGPFLRLGYGYTTCWDIN